MKKNIIVIDKDTEVREFFREYFANISAELYLLDTVKEALSVISNVMPYLVFVDQRSRAKKLHDTIEKLKKNGNELHFIGIRTPGEVSKLGFETETEIKKPIDVKSFESVIFKILRFDRDIKVLVVDDEAEICQNFRDYLELRKNPKFIIETANNGLEARKKFDQFKPEVLILDIKMPVKGGDEFYGEIKRSKKDVPTIVLTAAVSADELARLRRLGPQVYVEKGGEESSLPNIANTIKKLFIF